MKEGEGMLSETDCKCGVELIAAERQRQMEVEGWSPEHDDEHEDGELLEAGISYAEHVAVKGTWVPKTWPFDEGWWKPSPNPIRNLVKAGALIAAEIDRLQRVESHGEAPAKEE